MAFIILSFQGHLLALFWPLQQPEAHLRPLQELMASSSTLTIFTTAITAYKYTFYSLFKHSYSLYNILLGYEIPIMASRNTDNVMSTSWSLQALSRPLKELLTHNLSKNTIMNS
jgi:hypothetical protein